MVTESSNLNEEIGNDEAAGCMTYEIRKPMKKLYCIFVLYYIVTTKSFNMIVSRRLDDI